MQNYGVWMICKKILTTEIVRLIIWNLEQNNNYGCYGNILYLGEYYFPYNK